MHSPFSICHIQREIIHVGCRRHSVEEWMTFTKDEIAAMDIGALDYWKQMKDAIYGLSQACEPYIDFPIF